MTESPVELTRRAHAAFNARDLEVALALMADDIVIEPRMVAVEGELRGHAGVRLWWTQMFDVFPDYKNEILKIEAHGDGVVVQLRSRTQIGQSDRSLEETIWQGVQWRAGRCVWWGNFWDRDEALAALQARQGESSTPANAAVALSGFDIIKRRDLDAFVELMAPEVEIASRTSAMEGGYRGHEGARLWWAQYLEIFPDFSLEPLEATEVGDNGVLFKAQLHVSGAESATPVDEVIWHASCWHEDRSTWWGTFATRDEALAALQARQAAGA